MKPLRRIILLLSALVLLLSACGGGSAGSQNTASDEPAQEITWTEGRFENLIYYRPESMTELSFTPREGAESVAYGITNDEGKFYGFTIERIQCTPDDFDPLEPETFLQTYFPEHAEEYSIEELGDEDSGNEIARYNGNPVFARGVMDLSGAEGELKNADYLMEYLILDVGNNRGYVYILSVYDCDDFYPGTYAYFSLDFCRKLSFDNEAASAEDLASEDNAPMGAEGTVYEPVELVLGNYPQYDIPSYPLTIVGAEFFRHDGKEAIRIYYDVKNQAGNHWQAYEFFHLTATQDGEPLSPTYDYEANEKDVGYDGTNPEVLIDMANFVYDNEYANNRRCMMRDGYSVRMAEEYLCDWQAGPITLHISLPIYEYNLNFYDKDDPLIEELRKNCVKEVTFDPAEIR